jgi:hypothetical protein
VLSVNMLSVNMLSVNMLSVNVLSVNMLSVNMLSVNMLSVNVLSVNMLSVDMLSVNMLCVGVPYTLPCSVAGIEFSIFCHGFKLRLFIADGTILQTMLQVYITHTLRAAPAPLCMRQ